VLSREAAAHGASSLEARGLLSALRVVIVCIRRAAGVRRRPGSRR
jgi:hypothetical protein